ncbi:unnamed protein product [Peniophora sp. CBMAI 1063]|nr:unnamed protein product [Peniophora sp. CBMAI 1063]
MSLDSSLGVPSAPDDAVVIPSPAILGEESHVHALVSQWGPAGGVALAEPDADAAHADGQDGAAGAAVPVQARPSFFALVVAWLLSLFCSWGRGPGVG